MSPEAQQEVRAAYRWILGRDVDASGLDLYGNALDCGEINGATLRALLIDSPEFRAAHGRELMAIRTAEGVVVIVDPREPEFGSYIATHGGWEGQIVRTIVDHLPEGGVFVDVGANHGIMSFSAARKVGPQGRVIAFEPNPENVSNFRRGMLANGFDNILLYPLALSDQQRIITTSATSNAKVLDNNDPLSFHDVVQAVPADALLAGEPRIDLIKIDIEGYELPALQGMDQTLRRLSPRVLCEFNPLCLKANGAQEPTRLAEYIFAMAPYVEVVESNCELTRVSSSADLLSLWEERDHEAVRAGILAPGWVHFDLLFQPYR